MQSKAQPIPVDSSDSAAVAIESIDIEKLDVIAAIKLVADLVGGQDVMMSKLCEIRGIEPKTKALVTQWIMRYRQRGSYVGLEWVFAIEKLALEYSENFSGLASILNPAAGPIVQFVTDLYCDDADDGGEKIKNPVL